MGAGERERATAHELGTAVLGAVLGDDVDGLGAGDEVHGAAHARQHLAGHDPVGDVAFAVHLESAEERHVDVPTADHRERGDGVEVAAAGQERDGLIAGVGAVAVVATRGRAARRRRRRSRSG